MEKAFSIRRMEGTPQGGIISPVLANMALDGLGRRLEEKAFRAYQSIVPLFKVHLADTQTTSSSRREDRDMSGTRSPAA